VCVCAFCGDDVCLALSLYRFSPLPTVDCCVSRWIDGPCESLLAPSSQHPTHPPTPDSIQTGEVTDEKKLHEEKINTISWDKNKVCFITASNDFRAHLVDAQTLGA
jgi:hypothetical protein